jgi:hypothetical protein
MTTTNRRAFLKTAGIAAGAASLAASPALAAAGEPAAVETAPSGPIPGEPIVAVIRDAGSGQVTVFSGKTAKTYSDRALAKRLVRAASQNHSSETGVM